MFQNNVPHCKVGSVSVVLPAYNESQSLLELYSRLTAVLSEVTTAYEIIFVDDGSSDGTDRLIADLASQDEHVRGIVLTRNFGQDVAITAGLDSIRGDTAVTMDSDLQHRPEDIPRLLAKLDEGYDVVHGLRAVRAESRWKGLGHAIFDLIVNKWLGTGAPLRTGRFRAFDRRVVDVLCEIREQSRFLPGLISWTGFRQATVLVEDPGRMHGNTKYTNYAVALDALNGITGLSYRPLQLASKVGLATAVLAAAHGAWVLWRALFVGIPVPGYSSIFLAIVFFGSIQLMFLGLMGEYLGRTFMQTRGRPLYVIDRVFGNETAATGTLTKSGTYRQEARASASHDFTDERGRQPTGRATRQTTS